MDWFKYMDSGYLFFLIWQSTLIWKCDQSGRGGGGEKMVK